MEVSRIWRNQRAMYTLTGEVCDHCGNKIFPARDICPHCAEEVKILYELYKNRGYYTLVPGKAVYIADLVAK